MGKRQRYPAFQPFSASRSQKQEKARGVDDKTLLSPPAAIRGTTFFAAQAPEGPEGVFSRSFSLHSSTTRRAQLGAPAGELKMSLRTDATRLFERLAGRKEARKAAPEHQCTHDARTKPCDGSRMALDLGGVAAEQPTLEAMRASGRFWPRRGCSREISLPSGATRATAAASRHGPDNDHGPCSADLKPQMWPAPSQLPAIRCFCGDGFAAA